MSKEGRTYAVVRWNPALTVAQWNTAKGQGVIETSLTTVRKSLDGKKCILKWRGVTPPQLLGMILWSGTDAEMVAYLRTNTAEWNEPEVQPVSHEEIRPVMTAVEPVIEEIIPAPEPEPIPEPEPVPEEVQVVVEKVDPLIEEPTAVDSRLIEEPAEVSTEEMKPLITPVTIAAPIIHDVPPQSRIPWWVYAVVIGGSVAALIYLVS